MMLAGNEIINSARTEEYARQAGMDWFTGCAECDELGVALGDGEYRSPLLDKPPWFDPDDPDTWRFFGFYPLDITGADDSVRTANVTEAISDGGVIGPLRQATRAIVVNGMLIGMDECSVQAGMSWLRWALLGGHCEERPECTGDDLCFLACCPAICPDDKDYPDDCLDDYIRMFRLATVTEGPTVSAKHTMGDGGTAWEVQFTITCGVPWSYGAEQVIYDSPGEQFPSGSVIDNTPTCPDEVIPDLLDPWCPVVPKAPTVPKVNLACFSIPDNWDRYVFPITRHAIRVWQDAVPKVSIHTGDSEFHNIRLRWYADPLSRGETLNNPMQAVNQCDFCADFLITYIPPNSTFTLDGSEETVTCTVLTSKNRQKLKNASSLVMATDGGPFEWPVISCGYAYLLCVDVRHADPTPKRLAVSVYQRGI